MKLNGALKPRQGASRQGCSPGVILKKYRDKRYYKLNQNVVYGVAFKECGPGYTWQKQNTVKNSQNNKNINRETQTHQTPILKQQEKLYNKYFKVSNNNKSNTINSSNINNLSRRSKSSKLQQNKTTEYKIKAVIKKASFSSSDIKSDEGNTVKIPSVKAATAANEEKQKNQNNITTRQVENDKRENNYYTNNNSDCNKNERKNKSQQQTKEVQVVKTIKKISKHHVTVNKTYNSNNNNNKNSNKNNNSDLIHSKKQQQQQHQVVNKFLSIQTIYENLILCALIFWAAIISRLFIQLKLLLFSMYSHAIKHLTNDYQIDRCGHVDIGYHVGGRVYSFAVLGCKSIVETYSYRLAKIMRASQSFKEETFETISFKNMNKSHLTSSIALWIVVCATFAILLPQPVVGDDGENYFPNNGIDTTTPEFDYASRGQKKFGDKCENTLECGFPGSICDPKKKSCQCTEDLPVTNHIDKCGKEAAVNESCFFNEQCEVKYFQTECRDQRCVCRFDMTPVWLKDGTVECKGRGDKKGPETYIDPAMIGVLIGMALMFIIICVVLRLFSQARWRENRTIFNTPNPRLMNVSLLRESKLLHGQERRGSRMSVRVPSRQPSMASLRPHSPNPSLGKTGRMTRSKSNTRSSDSRVSDASNCSRLLEHHNTANVHHASHTHANATTNSQTNHGPYTSASVSPLSINAPSTTITYTNQTPVAGITTTCSTNLTTPPPTRSRSNSHGSNASATSLRSTRSNSVSPAGITVNNTHHERKGSTYQPHHHHHPPPPPVTHPQQQQHQQQQQQQEQQLLTQTNIISNPVAETVTVEIIEPEK